MRFLDYLAVSFRSLRRARLRSALTISAIVVGATGITIMLTFVTSVKNYVVNQFVQSGHDRQIEVGQSSDLSYHSSGAAEGGGGGPSVPGQAQLTSALAQRIGAIPHVTGVGAAMSNHGIQFAYLTANGKQLRADRIMAYAPNGVISPTLAAGRNFHAGDDAGVALVSKDYAKAMGYADPASAVGQTLTFHTMQGYTGVGAILPDQLPPENRCGRDQRNCMGGPTSGLPALDIPAKVIGVLSSSDGDLVIPLPWMIAMGNQAQPKEVQYRTPPRGPNQPPSDGVVRGGWVKPSEGEWLAQTGGFDSFLVNVDDSKYVAPVAGQIDGMGVNTATGLADLAKQKKAANTVAAVLGGLGLIALGIAALGIMNTMVMSVLERTREIGVMRAVGARAATVRRLFTFEAALLGFFGGLFGVVIGYGFVAVAKPVIRNTFKSGDISGTNFSVPPWLVLVVLAGTTLIGLLSGLLPSRRASRLDPVEALRYE